LIETKKNMKFMKTKIISSFMFFKCFMVYLC